MGIRPMKDGTWMAGVNRFALKFFNTSLMLNSHRHAVLDG
jgi:hypothetical protein